MAIKPSEMNTYPEITQGDLNGHGLFDELMHSVKQHLAEEFSSQRIKGTDYSKVYLGSLESVLSNTTSYLANTALHPEQKEQIKAQTEQVREQTELTRLQQDKTKEETKLVQAQTAQVIAETELIPLQKDKLIADTNLVNAQTDKIRFEIDFLLPLELQKLELEVTRVEAEVRRVEAEILMINAQIDKINRADIPLALANISQVNKNIELLQEQISTALFNRTEILPLEKSKLTQEIRLIEARYQTEWAQTHDALEDATAIAGISGAQIALYKQQTEGFIREAEVKAARLMIETWSVDKTIDDTVIRPSALLNDDISAVMKTVLFNATGVQVTTDASEPPIHDPAAYALKHGGATPTTP